MPVSILATKLYIPPPRLQVMSRSRLNQQLNEGLSRKLTLVSASAGFGKTTLVSEWIPSVSRSAAWLSLDEEDSDRTRFLSYLVAAIQTVIPDIGKNLQAELQSPQPPPMESILTNLLNDILRVDKPLLLVLDDYHVLDTKPIDAKNVDNILTFLLEHMPPPLHLVITTRENPNNLPLARLRARNQLVEIGIADLRFTVAEAGEFLKQMMGLKLSEKDITALEARTEGWIAGLQLAALSMKGHKDLPTFVKSFTGGHHFVLDYLLKEVLQAQTEDVRHFLLCTSILDRLYGPLCDAVLQDAKYSAQQILESIELANLFLIPLDNQRQWYRYHHLFADVLQAHLAKEQPDKLSVLHLRASEWFEKKGQRPEAIRHALAAKDDERAAELIELGYPDADRFAFAAPWLGWVKALPEKLVRKRPVLMRNYAQALFFMGKFEEGERWLSQVERLFDLETDGGKSLILPPGMKIVDEKQFRELPASVAFSRGYQAIVNGDVVSVIQRADRILKLIPEDDYSKRSEALGMKAFSYWAVGELDAASHTFSENVTIMRNNGLFAESVIATFILADTKTVQGRLTDVANLYENAIQLLPKQGPIHQGTSFLYTGLSNLYREWGNHELAMQTLQKSIELNQQAPLQLCQYRISLAQASERQSLGDLDGTLEELDRAEQLYYRNVVPEFQTVGALKAQTWIKQGHLNEALTWVRKQKLSVEDETNFAREFDHITLARLLLAQYRKEGHESILNQTRRFLERLHQAAKTGKRVGRLIEILILQSLLHQAGRDTKKALESLQHALNLAEPEGYMQIFVDEGVPLELLLRVAEAKAIMPDYVSKILQVLEKNRAQNNTSTSSAASLNDALVESLSKRELEVLKLIAQGLSNQEISKKLFIALSSVKGHNQKIFAKLQVHRRTEAVARARELGLV